jgi:hypothetical protein
MMDLGQMQDSNILTPTSILERSKRITYTYMSLRYYSVTHSIELKRPMIV